MYTYPYIFKNKKHSYNEYNAHFIKVYCQSLNNNDKKFVKRFLHKLTEIP